MGAWVSEAPGIWLGAGGAGCRERPDPACRVAPTAVGEYFAPCLKVAYRELIAGADLPIGLCRLARPSGMPRRVHPSKCPARGVAARARRRAGFQ